MFSILNGFILFICHGAKIVHFLAHRITICTWFLLQHMSIEVNWETKCHKQSFWLPIVEMIYTTINTRMARCNWDLFHQED
jgi:hypothetical protein